MSLREILDVILRQRVLCLAVLGLTMAAGFVVAQPRPVYSASETFAVQPPRSPQVPNQLNMFRPSLAITAAVVAQRLKSPSGERQLRSRGLLGEYDVVPRNSGTVQTPAYVIPSLQATVSTHDRASALRGVALLVRVFQEELDSIQDEVDVAADQRITLSVLAAADAVRQAPARARALAGVALLGLAALVLVPLWYQQVGEWLRRRRVRRAAAGTSSAVAVPVPPPPRPAAAETPAGEAAGPA